MMKKSIAVLLICISSSIFSQEFLNLDFEYAVQGIQTPMRWYIGTMGYTISLDDSEKFSQSRSLKMVSNNPKGNEFGVCTGSFPIDLVKGKNIEFTGAIKTKDIENGWAGLWWRVDGKDKILGFDNMSDRGLSGTNEWKQVSIQMKVDENVTNINFGGLFVGTGTAWFDHFEIIIEGKKFNDLVPRITVPTGNELIWLKSQVYPLRTVDPGSESDEDLQILLELIGNAKVVAVGETSHGSSEIFKMKHRIIKFLTENAAFDIFSIEANMPEAYKINEYTVKGNGNPADLIRGMYFWTWRTQEVLDMVEWMKKHNESDRKIYFTGFDLQYYQGAIEELNKAFITRNDILDVLSNLENSLEAIRSDRMNNQRAVVSQEDEMKIGNQVDSIRKYISKSDLPVKERDWLLQNIRIIEQYLDYITGARDRYMAENLLWIKSQNPDSKIAMWAHNGHIKKTGVSMGRYLSDSLKEDYLTIGFTFHKGYYTAVGDNGLTSYPAQESFAGTYEYFFNSIDEPIFILDLREAKKQNSENSKWLTEKLLFRTVGAAKMNNEFSDTDLTEDFDLIIFINESSSSQLLY